MDRVEKLGKRLRRYGAAAALPAATLAVSLALAVAGCGEDDGKVVGPPGGGGPPTYATPQSTLRNLITAYVNRDSVETAAAYDVAYQGISTDLAGAPVVYTFTRADEVRHVARLKLDPNIVSVAVDFGPESTWLRDSPQASDPPEWAVLHITGATIEIQDIASQATHRAAGNPMAYTFIPTVHAPGDTTWKIIRWTEIRN